MGKDENVEQDDLDWERRVLCSDEACIGTIGPDGCCRECGKPYEGELPEALHRSSADNDNEDAQSPADGADAEMQAEDPIGAADETAFMDDADDEWAQRRLCSDEACIGTIGPDGLCKECGKPYVE